MEIPRYEAIEMLRSRGDHHEADLAEAELPETLDLDADGGLLTKFGVHPPELLARHQA